MLKKNCPHYVAGIILAFSPSQKQITRFIKGVAHTDAKKTCVCAAFVALVVFMLLDVTVKK